MSCLCQLSLEYLYHNQLLQMYIWNYGQLSLLLPLSFHHNHNKDNGCSLELADRINQYQCNKSLHECLWYTPGDWNWFYHCSNITYIKNRLPYKSCQDSLYKVHQFKVKVQSLFFLCFRSLVPHPTFLHLQIKLSLSLNIPLDFTFLPGLEMSLTWQLDSGTGVITGVGAGSRLKEGMETLDVRRKDWFSLAITKLHTVTKPTR